MKTNFTGLTKNMRIARYGVQLHPVRDWFFILGIGTALLVASVLSNLWYFAKVTGGESIGTDTAAPAVRGVNLAPVNDLFERRAAERARYLGEYRFVDPSGGRGSVEEPISPP